MMTLKKGNLLEAKVEALVNTVNCVGIMGKGIALQFKLAFPANYLAPLTLHGGTKGTCLPPVSQTGRLENRKVIRTNRRYSYPIFLTFESRIDTF